ncbi:MAG TPA: nuclear transport factor 2 family protein [Chitinophagaceae bacterium]
MLKLIPLCALLVAVTACNNKTETPPPESADTGTTTAKVIPETKTLPELPGYVVFNNWEMGDPERTKLILNVYAAWDASNTTEMASYFADSAVYDLPDGSRRITTSKNIETTFHKWRHGYKETSNIPFSLISLYNKDQDQEWVIAWTWNKWRDAYGKRDSMLYCDNWRISHGKITYLNSLENKPSAALARQLNKRIPKQE